MNQPSGATVSRLAAALGRLAGDLDALHRRRALAGGLAVHAHTGTGATDDIDVAVATTGDPDAERLVGALQGRGYSAVTAIEDAAVGRLASVRLELLGQRGSVDPIQLLFASSGIEPEIIEAAVPREVFGRRLPVAGIGHLIATKLLSHEPGRPQDGEDLAALLEAASEDDLRQAEDALALITERGYSRGRDLAAEYERFLARQPGAGAL